MKNQQKLYKYNKMFLIKLIFKLQVNLFEINKLNNQMSKRRLINNKKK